MSSQTSPSLPWSLTSPSPQYTSGTSGTSQKEIRRLKSGTKVSLIVSRILKYVRMYFQYFHNFNPIQINWMDWVRIISKFEGTILCLLYTNIYEAYITRNTTCSSSYIFICLFPPLSAHIPCTTIFVKLHSDLRILTILQLFGVGVDFVFPLEEGRKEGRRRGRIGSSRGCDSTCLKFLVGVSEVFGNCLEGVWQVS